MSSMKWRDAIVYVLERSSVPMHYSDIADEIAELELRESLGATPAITVNSTINLDIRGNGKKSVFVSTYETGVYGLKNRDYGLETEAKAVEGESDSQGLPTCYGLYWERAKAEDSKSSSFKIEGHQGKNSVDVNFGRQIGIYVLHDRREIVYIGQTSRRSLEERLKEHTKGRFSTRWDRFSWFGFHEVTDDGVVVQNTDLTVDADTLLNVVEGILIELLEPGSNRRGGQGFDGKEYEQKNNLDPMSAIAELLQTITASK